MLRELICRSLTDSSQDVRRALGLKAKDLHVTLGFKVADIHGVAKDETTLVATDDDDDVVDALAARLAKLL